MGHYAGPRGKRVRRRLARSLIGWLRAFPQPGRHRGLPIIERSASVVLVETDATLAQILVHNSEKRRRNPASVSQPLVLFC